MPQKHILGAAGALAIFGAFAATSAPGVPHAPHAPAADSVPAVAAALLQPIHDSLQGRSGKLRARFVPAPKATNFAYLRALFGDTARPGVYPVPTQTSGSFAFIAMLPFSQKIAGKIGSYRIGFWPGENGTRRIAAKRGAKNGSPEGFIQVTPDNQRTAVSEHFTLADFLTHDQQAVWPKYLVLHESLVDKLELVLAELKSQGYDAKALHVMSGFRTPQYNESGGDPSGRAELSRHQYGDAADVWVENGAGRMADLNGDGRINASDAAIVARAAERVEQTHPDLIGGVGIYRATGAHGPFVHIDTRGYRARWGSV
jgi:hypothetical protein